MARLSFLHFSTSGVKASTKKSSLLVVVLVRLVHHVLKRLSPVNKVARVDANLLDGIGDGERHLGREVHVRA